MQDTKNAYIRILKFEPLFHVLLWSIVLCYPYIKYIGKEGGYMMSLSHELNSLFFKMTISYFLYTWFFPKNDKKKYIPVVILAFIINALVYEYFDRFFHVNNDHFWKHFIANILTYLSFGVVFFAIYSVKSLYKKQTLIEALSREKKEAEMRALKAQVTPHFLFNTLNTLYANALKKDDKTPDLILKLSDNFRYLLHEGQNNRVTIDLEIQHLQDYIYLQQERLSKKVIVNFIKDIDNPEQEIAPLLCIVFVENAFKYTSRLKGLSHPIQIQLELKNSVLNFTCINSFNADNNQIIDTDWEQSGIGIKNVKNRLKLLYPGKHTLTIEKDQKVFKVNLTIKL